MQISPTAPAGSVCPVGGVVDLDFHLGMGASQGVGAPVCLALLAQPHGASLGEREGNAGFDSCGYHADTPFTGDTEGNFDFGETETMLRLSIDAR